jgi:hypothetical protein
MKMDNTPGHLAEDDIVRYRKRNMPPAELLVADRHLAFCDICHARMTEWPELAENVSAAAKAFTESGTAETAHLTFEQLTGLVDDQVGDIDREILESHLQICESCETGLNRLQEDRGTKTRRASDPKHDAQPGKRTLWDAFKSLRPLPAFGLMASAVVALALLTSIPLIRENAEMRARVAALERDKAALRDKSATVDDLQTAMTELRQENESLRRSAEDHALVALNDGGGRITLDAQGTLSGIQPAQYEQTVREALQSERVKLPPSLRALRGSSGTLMGGDQPGFNLVAPVGIVIETDRPSFRWSPLADATSYTVTVYDETLSRVASSAALTTTEWMVTTPLPRGKTYIWQVRASRNGDEVVAPAASRSRAKFKVLDQSRLDEIKRARSAHSSSHLVMGVIYAGAGLVEDAEREFKELIQANPESAAARKLLGSLRAAER